MDECGEQQHFILEGFLVCFEQKSGSSMCTTKLLAVAVHVSVAFTFIHTNAQIITVFALKHTHGGSERVCADAYFCTSREMRTKASELCTMCALVLVHKSLKQRLTCPNL